MGGMGGGQPLGATMNGAAFLGIDVDPERIKRRGKTGYCDVMVTSLDEALRILKNAVRKGEATSVAAMGEHVQGMLELQKLGAVTFDYGNNIRTFAFEAGVKNAYGFPGFVPAYIRPLFCEGKGPFRWAALSGEASDIARTDRLVLEMFPENEHLKRWVTMAQKKVKFQGLPSRICWLGYGERDT